MISSLQLIHLNDTERAFNVYSAVEINIIWCALFFLQNSLVVSLTNLNVNDVKFKGRITGILIWNIHSSLISPFHLNSLYKHNKSNATNKSVHMSQNTPV